MLEIAFPQISNTFMTPGSWQPQVFFSGVLNNIGNTFHLASTLHFGVLKRTERQTDFYHLQIWKSNKSVVSECLRHKRNHHAKFQLRRPYAAKTLTNKFSDAIVASISSYWNWCDFDDAQYTLIMKVGVIHAPMKEIACNYWNIFWPIRRQYFSALWNKWNATTGQLMKLPCIFRTLNEWCRASLLSKKWVVRNFKLSDLG